MLAIHGLEKVSLDPWTPEKNEFLQDIAIPAPIGNNWLGAETAGFGRIIAPDPKIKKPLFGIIPYLLLGIILD